VDSKVRLNTKPWLSAGGLRRIGRTGILGFEKGELCFFRARFLERLLDQLLIPFDCNLLERHLRRCIKKMVKADLELGDVEVASDSRIACEQPFQLLSIRGN
jgi:hypothetical protein